MGLLDGIGLSLFYAALFAIPCGFGYAGYYVYSLNSERNPEKDFVKEVDGCLIVQVQLHYVDYTVSHCTNSADDDGTESCTYEDKCGHYYDYRFCPPYLTTRLLKASIADDHSAALETRLLSQQQQECTIYTRDQEKFIRFMGDYQPNASCTLTASQYTGICETTGQPALRSKGFVEEVCSGKCSTCPKVQTWLFSSSTEPGLKSRYHHYELGGKQTCWLPKPPPPDYQFKNNTPYGCYNEKCYKLTDPHIEFVGIMVFAYALFAVAGMFFMIGVPYWLRSLRRVGKRCKRRGEISEYDDEYDDDLIL